MFLNVEKYLLFLGALLEKLSDWHSAEHKGVVTRRRPGSLSRTRDSDRVPKQDWVADCTGKEGRPPTLPGRFGALISLVKGGVCWSDLFVEVLDYLPDCRFHKAWMLRR